MEVELLRTSRRHSKLDSASRKHEETQGDTRKHRQWEAKGRGKTQMRRHRDGGDRETGGDTGEQG